MDFFIDAIKILNGVDESVFVAVQNASYLSGYSNQYLRKMLRHNIIHGIKIGQVWFIDYKSFSSYVRIASRMNDRRYGARKKKSNEIMN